MTVNWKVIEQFPKYEISDNGQVKSNITNRILKPRKNASGFLLVTIVNKHNRKLPYIHRLVAQEFIPNPDNLRFVKHIDGNKNNNKVSNLEWVRRCF